MGYNVHIWHAAVLLTDETDLISPRQYMDAYRLSFSRIENGDAKEAKYLRNLALTFWSAWMRLGAEPSAIFFAIRNVKGPYGASYFSAVTLSEVTDYVHRWMAYEAEFWPFVKVCESLHKETVCAWGHVDRLNFEVDDLRTGLADVSTQRGSAIVSPDFDEAPTEINLELRALTGRRKV